MQSLITVILSVTLSLTSFASDNITAIPVSSPFVLNLNPTDFPVTDASFNPDREQVQAILTTPSGRKLTVYAFVMQDFTLTETTVKQPRPRATPIYGDEFFYNYYPPDDNATPEFDEKTVEQLSANSNPYWQFRIYSDEIGLHQLSIETKSAKSPNTRQLYRQSNATTIYAWQTIASPETVTAQRVKVSIDNPRSLALTNNQPFFAVGFNLAWVDKDQTVKQYRQALQALQQAGGNWARIWFCTWGLHPEGDKPYKFNLEEAWKIDQILQIAAEYGIKLQICIWNFFDMRNHRERTPYLQLEVNQAGQIFTSYAARRQQRAFLRYIVNRWGGNPTIFAWELWNEQNYVHNKYMGESLTGLSYQQQLYWTQTTARYLSTIDRKRHLISTSFGPGFDSKSFWELPEIDFTQVHTYIPYVYSYYSYNNNDKNKADANEVELIKSAVTEAIDINKPMLISECGFHSNSSTSSRNNTDPTGIHVHNLLWAGVFSGSVLTPALWWWDSYILTSGDTITKHYQAMSKFVATIDWSLAWTPAQADTDQENILFLYSQDNIILWLQKKQADWYSRLNKTSQVASSSYYNYYDQRERQNSQNKRENLTTDSQRFLSLSNLQPGNWQINWIDTNSGDIIAQQEIEAGETKVKIPLPQFEWDIAAKLIRQ